MKKSINDLDNLDNLRNIIQDYIKIYALIKNITYTDIKFYNEKDIEINQDDPTNNELIKQLKHYNSFGSKTNNIYKNSIKNNDEDSSQRINSSFTKEDFSVSGNKQNDISETLTVINTIFNNTFIETKNYLITTLLDDVMYDPDDDTINHKKSILYIIPTTGNNFKPLVVLKNLNLQSIILHNGATAIVQGAKDAIHITAASGHYICVFKCNDYWYLYNDLNKTKVMQINIDIDDINTKTLTAEIVKINPDYTAIKISALYYI